jgi:hypothetical protein
MKVIWGKKRKNKRKKKRKIGKVGKKNEKIKKKYTVNYYYNLQCIKCR